jgi:hypothetical protein
MAGIKGAQGRTHQLAQNVVKTRTKSMFKIAGNSASSESSLEESALSGGVRITKWSTHERCGKCRVQSLTPLYPGNGDTTFTVASLSSCSPRPLSLSMPTTPTALALHTRPILLSTPTTLFLFQNDLYQWLSAVITSTNYHGALKARLEDTGLWFIDGACFAWCNG